MFCPIPVYPVHFQWRGPSVHYYYFCSSQQCVSSLVTLQKCNPNILETPILGCWNHLCVQGYIEIEIIYHLTDNVKHSNGAQCCYRHLLLHGTFFAPNTGNNCPLSILSIVVRITHRV